MSDIRLNKDMIGKEVRLVKIINSYNPDKIGATGVIVDYDEADKSNMHYLVNWNFNGHEWETWPNDEEIEEVVENKGVKDDKGMTNEEIWEMLKPKLLKNYIFPNNVSEAVGMAYRVGYLRAMKGRPFKIGEKKKKDGHWEPVDPNNLPKEGTRVRYARECVTYNDSLIKIGDTGVVEWDGVYKPDWFGVKLDNPRGWMKWACFDDEEDSLDMWVEDDG